MTHSNFGSSEKNTQVFLKGFLCASHFAELVTAAIEHADEDEKRANLVAVDTRLSALNGPITRWVNDVVTSVPAAFHARAWKHLMPANQVVGCRGSGL